MPARVHAPSWASSSLLVDGEKNARDPHTHTHTLLHSQARYFIWLIFLSIYYYFKNFLFSVFRSFSEFCSIRFRGTVSVYCAMLLPLTRLNLIVYYTFDAEKFLPDVSVFLIFNIKGKNGCCATLLSPSKEVYKSPIKDRLNLFFIEKL